MITSTGRENPKFYRGVLESAGLAEVSFFLKEAEKNILYATIALENTDFSSFDELHALQAKIVKLRGFVAEIGEDMGRAELELVAAVEKKEEDGDSDEGQHERY
jgi:hypothetical protein